MSTKRKTPQELDGMIEHVRYELVQSIQFVRLGNAWCARLSAPHAALAYRSLLEAGLVHFRCLIEFLGNQPTGDQVMARDYLPDWDWTISEQLERVGDLHGRLAHLGKIRLSDPFNWAPWLNTQAPTVLQGVRDFLVQLRKASPRRYELFIAPSSELSHSDLATVLNAMV